MVKKSFLAGECPNMYSIGMHIAPFLKQNRFVKFTIRKGKRSKLSAVYAIAATSTMRGRTGGTELMLIKLFGAKELPQVATFEMNKVLPFDVRFMKETELAEAAMQESKISDAAAVAINGDLARSLQG